MTAAQHRQKPFYISCILCCVYHWSLYQCNVSCVMSADNGMVVMLTVIVLHKLSVGHTNTTTIDCIEWILLEYIEIKLNGWHNAKHGKIFGILPYPQNVVFPSSKSNLFFSKILDFTFWILLLVQDLLWRQIKNALKDQWLNQLD